ncbi:MAG: NAD-dependent epimerase/dehydratase family protein [Bradymonadaceae bacterium]
MKPYVLTGATGFVGSHLAQRLWNDGTSLRLLVRPTSDLTRLPPALYRAVLDGNPRLTLFEGDLTDPSSLTGLCTDTAGIYHLACAVKGTFDESQASSHVFEEVNVQGTQNIATAANQAGVRMVHVSSTAAMGAPQVPVVDESTACDPTAPYQRSKYDAERRLLDMHRDADLDVVILRPCLILGPGKEGGEVLKLFTLVRQGIFPAIGDALQCTKPLVDVRDVAQACVRAMEFGTSGEVYLINSGTDHRLGEIIEAARRLVGARRATIPLPVAPLRVAALGFEGLARVWSGFNPPLTRHRLDLYLANRRISIDKARTELGYEPEHQDVYDMLGMTYVGYVRDGQLSP